MEGKAIIKVEDVTPEQLKAWKDEFKQLKKITVVTKSGGKIPFIVARPTRDILDMYAFKVDKDENKAAREVLQVNCILAGDTTLFAEDVNLESTVMKKITGMLESLDAIEEEL